jgi:hypothetical protein
VAQFNMTTDDIKDLSIAALIGKMLGLPGSTETQAELRRLLGFATSTGMSGQSVNTLSLAPPEVIDGARRGKTSK